LGVKLTAAAAAYVVYIYFEFGCAERSYR